VVPEMVVLEVRVPAADQVLRAVLAGSLGHPVAWGAAGQEASAPEGLRVDQEAVAAEAVVLAAAPGAAAGRARQAADSVVDQQVAAAEAVVLEVVPGAAVGQE